MKQSKLIDILSTLSTTEINRFEKYVTSPYFNVHQDTIGLFRVLKDYYPDFHENDVRKETIFERLYPDSPYDREKLYTLKKYLVKLLYDFLAVEATQKDTAYQNALLIADLLGRRLNKYVPKLLSEAETELEKGRHTMKYYFHKFNFAFHSLSLGTAKQNRSTKHSYQGMLNQLDYFFITAKLKYACEVLNRSKVVSSNEQIRLLDAILALCEKESFDEIPTVTIYYQTYKMLSEKDGEPFYKKLRAKVNENIDLMPKSDLINLYIFMINFCFRRTRVGKAHFMRDVFELYQEMLKYDLIFVSASTGAIHYKNITTIALKLKEYEWVEKFLKKYAKRLDPSLRTGVQYYNLANLYFTQGLYSKSLRHLQRVEFIDPFYRMSYNILLLKTYYECDEIEPLLSLCSTFSTFIRRNKTISENVKPSYLNLTKFLKKLYQHKHNPRKKNPLILYQNIFECKQLVERNWLFAKTLELVPEPTPI